MIVVADLHLRYTIPRCRGESQQEWLDHQRYRLREIVRVARNDSILVAGDIFHTPIVPVEIINMFIEEFGSASIVYIMPGNHDLRYRDTSLKDTAYEVLNTLCSVHGGPFVRIQDTYAEVLYGADHAIGVVNDDLVAIHTLTFESEKKVPYGVKEFETSESLFKKYSHKFLIVGDMHRPFIAKKGGRVLVNCGSLTVQNKNEAEYEHGYTILDMEDGVATFVPFEDKCIIVKDNKLLIEEARDGRINAFVEELKAKSEGISLDYIENLKNKLTSADVNSKVRERVSGYINTVKEGMK